MKSIFQDICDAISNVDLRRLVYEENGSSAQKVTFLCNLFASAWPLQESILHELGGESTSKWKNALKDLVGTAGRDILKFSHDQGVRQRSFEEMEENWKRRHQDEFTRLVLEMLAAYVLEHNYRVVPIKILVVDNKPQEIPQYDILLPPQLGFAFWQKAEWYVVGDKDDKDADLICSLEEEICNLKRKELQSQKPLNMRRWDPMSGDLLNEEQVNCADIDLILQDQYLGDDKKSLLGSRLAEHYIDVMPQALVFLFTGTDVSELAALGEMRFVDRVISKTRLAALPWYYYLAFREVLGAMLWEPWLKAKDEETKRIFSRWTLRRLLGSIRTWIKEPEILWHGQTCAELVDHSQPHISDMWRMTNEIFGARNQEGGQLLYDRNRLRFEERILLALGVWTHDIGHRGDDERIDSVSIRETHASISEGLLLSNRKAFGLEWLDKLCSSECGCRKRKGEDKRFVRTNVGESQNGELCLLRLTGIVSRHHQSSVPLLEKKLAGLITGLKTLHDYTRLGYYNPIESPKTTSIEEWCGDDEDLDWVFRDVQCLENFVKHSPEQIELMKVTCLLRFLDAIHLHRCRAGSRYKIETHRDYRDKRDAYCNKECNKLLHIMQESPQGSRAYMHAYERYVALISYQQQLLAHQDPHLWRQEIVEKREVKADGNNVRIEYSLRTAKLGSADRYWNKAEKLWVRELRNFVKKKAKAKGKLISQLKDLTKKQGRAEYACWTMNFLDDVVGSELKGQSGDERTFPEELEKVFGRDNVSIVIRFPIERAPVIEQTLGEIWDLKIVG